MFLAVYMSASFRGHLTGRCSGKTDVRGFNPNRLWWWTGLFKGLKQVRRAGGGGPMRKRQHYTARGRDRIRDRVRGRGRDRDRGRGRVEIVLLILVQALFPHHHTHKGFYGPALAGPMISSPSGRRGSIGRRPNDFESVRTKKTTQRQHINKKNSPQALPNFFRDRDRDRGRDR